MTLNQIFSAPRFLNLFREETSSGYKLTFVVASVTFVFLLVISQVVAADQAVVNFHEIWYKIILMAGGFYFTSTSFDELNKKEQRMNYLSLPASVFEKFTMKLLITTIGWVVGFTLLYWLFASVTGAIAKSVFGFSFIPFNPFGEYEILIIKLYLVIQSVFLLGAVTFDRFSFFKTNFALNILSLIVVAIALILFRIIFAAYFDSLFKPQENVLVIPNKGFQDFAQYTLWPIVQNVFWYVLAPLLWVVAYFKLKEREV